MLLRRRHNADVEWKWKRAIYKAELTQLEEPQDDCPNVSDWIDEKVVTRLQIAF